MRVHRFLTVIVAAAVAACSDTPLPLASSNRPFAEIVDAAHGGGTGSFYLLYFLPPLVENPGTGVNLTNISPAVDICAWKGTACTGELLAHFTTSLETTTTSQPGNSETVRLSQEGAIVNWHTDAFNLAIDGTYRIRVIAGGEELGHADVDVVGSGKDLKNVNTGAFIGLVDGRTLPIKFRIQQPDLQPE
jgi:hypothetical protein